jgi:RNA polymerase sigma factor (sigma-70 family)
MKLAAAGCTPTVPGPEVLDSTANLLARIREGDRSAREQLVGRYIQTMKRWAHGRLPASARGLVDTDDLVQSTLIRSLNRLGSFEPRHDGAFLAYLRRALLNLIRDEIRRASWRPEAGPACDAIAAREPTPMENLLGRETLQRYEEAFGRLSDREQVAVFLRVELGMEYRAIAKALGIPTPNAARMYVVRAIARLAERLRKDGVDG